jgi:transcriptional regulator with XRE-family HTH domain
MVTRHTERTTLIRTSLTQVEAARQLGVSRVHLNKVLRGHRQSRSLTNRYQALIQQEAGK